MNSFHEYNILYLVSEQKGLAPILIVLLIALAVGGYLIYSNYIKERILTYKEVEEFIINCKVYSIGRSHNDLEKGYLSIGVREINIKEDRFKIDKNYGPQISKKIEDVTSSGKCPKVTQWIE